MLAKSAERVYWLARYIERSENLARLVSVHMNLLLDLPKNTLDWRTLLYITGNEAAFYSQYPYANEQSVTHFLLTDADNPQSLYASIIFARENMRTSRNLLPDEAWELVNELYLFVKNNEASINSRRERVIFLSTILAHCQRFNGLLMTTMSQTYPYFFIQIGQNLERADMCTRILEFAAMLLAEDRSALIRQYEGILWVNILKAQGGLAMYRQHVRSKVQGHEVLNYLLKDDALPRSVKFCLHKIATVMGKLPAADAVLLSAIALIEQINAIDVQQTDVQQLHHDQDLLQTQIANLHEKIAQTWFLSA